MAENHNSRNRHHGGGQRRNQPGQGRRNDKKRNHNRHGDGKPYGQRDRKGGYQGKKYGRRGGKGREHTNTARTDRQRVAGPDIPEWADAGSLPGDIRRELHMLSKENAEQVAAHMVAAYGFVEEDPKRALAHAHAARDHAGRIAVVRENAGVIAYLTGNWKEALSELRTARRIGGGPGLLPLMADCQRGLNRPEKAIEMMGEEHVKQLTDEDFNEFIIVIAGAYSDLEKYDEAKKVLEKGDLDPTRVGTPAARLFYAYADVLLALNDTDGAQEWFERAELADENQETDAQQRLAELTDK